MSKSSDGAVGSHRCQLKSTPALAEPVRLQMNIFLRLFQTTLGKKYIMAGTGAALFIFVIIHLLGNLQIFMGPDRINAYGAILKARPEALWSARIGLLLMVVLHIVAAAKLSAENRRARPQAYGQFNPIGSTYASRTMLMSGLIIFAFVVYHLLHFTVAVPAVNLLPASAGFPEADFLALRDEQGRHDVYRMMVLGFSNIWVSGFYILSMVLLGMHLSHGVNSMFQSMGIRNRRLGAFTERLALSSAIVIFLGNISIPIAVLLGFVS
jgi:succinate dehydrogenase / fumarate reductase, cytochrome b subunit